MKTKTDVLITIAILLMAVGITNQVLRVAKAEPIDTYHSSWHRVEDSASEDAADFATSLPLDANEGDWANKTSEAFRIRSEQAGARYEGYSPGAAWMFAFYGTDAADETFSFTMVGWAKTNGFAQIICEGDGLLGSQDVVIEPNGDSIDNGFWADTISLDETSKWPSVGVYNASGNDEVAILLVDMTGLEWVDFVTYDVAGSAEASTLGVYGRRY